jgi:prevent-host-death family protein
MQSVPCIRPVSDLENNFSSVYEEARTTGEPIFLTEHDHPALVLMSAASYQQEQYDLMVWAKLRESEIEEELHPQEVMTCEEVHDRIRENIRKMAAEEGLEL